MTSQRPPLVSLFFCWVHICHVKWRDRLSSVIRCTDRQRGEDARTLTEEGICAQFQDPRLPVASAQYGWVTQLGHCVTQGATDRQVSASQVTV